MNSLLIGDALQEGCQLFAFVIHERRTQCPLMLSRNQCDALQNFATFRRILA